MIKDKKGSENFVVNYLSRLVNTKVTNTQSELQEEFPNEKLMMVKERPWFADITNFKATRVIPEDFNWHQKNKFLRDA